MIVKVFDNIFISNVYDANNIYQLINLNIGGILTCFGCKSIDWCQYNINDNNKIFFKDKFIKFKHELKRDYHFPSEEATYKLSANCEKKIKDIEMNDNTQGNSKNSDLIEDSDLDHRLLPHCDYIVFPNEILNQKIDNNTIKSYVKAMINLNDDVDINCINYQKNENIKKDETKKEKEVNKDKREICKNENEENILTEKELNTQSLNKIPKVVDILKEEKNRDVTISCVNNENEKNNIIELESENKILNVCQLNKSLREDNKIPFNNIYKMKHLHLNILDTFDENILNHINKAHSFIDNVIEEKKNVLVHCMAGISRCSSIILSYVSKKNKKGINENFSLLKNKYPFAHPNENFFRQLLLYEKMNYTLDVKKIRK